MKNYDKEARHIANVNIKFGKGTELTNKESLVCGTPKGGEILH